MGRSLDKRTEKRVDRQLRRGADVEAVAERLVRKGWDAEDARVVVDARDQAIQDELREANMKHTHSPRSLAKSGGSAVGALVMLWLIARLIRMLFILQ